jgi:hypothetical protein
MCDIGHTEWIERLLGKMELHCLVSFCSYHSCSCLCSFVLSLSLPAGKLQATTGWSYDSQVWVRVYSVLLFGLCSCHGLQSCCTVHLRCMSSNQELLSLRVCACQCLSVLGSSSLT